MVIFINSFLAVSQAYYQVKSHSESWHYNTLSVLDCLDSGSYKLLLSCTNARAMRSRYDSHQNDSHNILKSAAVAARLDFSGKSSGP